MPKKTTTVIESDLRRVVTAAHYGRLCVTAGGRIVEKLNTSGINNIPRASATRCALDQGLLELRESGFYVPTAAGRERFGLSSEAVASG